MDGQQIGEMQDSDLRSLLQKHLGSPAPSGEVEDTGPGQPLFQGTVGKEIVNK